MESKQELTQMITRLGGERRQYLNDFLRIARRSWSVPYSTRRFPEEQRYYRREWIAALCGGS